MNPVSAFRNKGIDPDDIILTVPYPDNRKDYEMKHYTKIIILAGILALCLILAGCQQSGGTGNQTGNAGAPEHFATYPPSQQEPLYPDSVDNGMQNEDGEESFPTSGLPFNTANPWDNAGTDALQPTETPYPQDTYNPYAGATIESVTVPPVTPTPTEGPSPTPKSIQRGFTGSDAVRDIQKRLKELGYYKGSADGDFGPATEKAVMAFQKANGLTADGKVGEKTLAKLNSSKASSSKGSSAKATATPKVSKNTYLVSGSSGKQVKTMQKRLIELGWLSGSASGSFDSATEAAVIAFQKKAKLWADGKAGPKTLEALYSSKAPKSSKPASSNETLEKGSKGSEVKKMQKRLKELGYMSGEADGSFGDATETAVKLFQDYNGLTADGKAGTATLNLLYSDSAKKYSTGSDDNSIYY